MIKRRCDWCGESEIYTAYHDHEWGVPIYDDQKLFELINLEGAQAGLSWITILKKRDNYFELFDGWDAEKIVNYDSNKVQSLLQNPGIIRNKLKIASVITNARVFLDIMEEEGFSNFLWKYVDGAPIVNQFESMDQIPSKTELSDRISKDLKKRGFKFVGSTIVYAFMQSMGMVDDHLAYCFKRTET